MQRRTSVPLGVERSLERRIRVRSVELREAVRERRRRMRSFWVLERRGEAVGGLSGCSVGVGGSVGSEGIVVLSGCVTSIVAFLTVRIPCAKLCYRKNMISVVEEKVFDFDASCLFDRGARNRLGIPEARHRTCFHMCGTCRTLYQP